MESVLRLPYGRCCKPAVEDHYSTPHEGATSTIGVSVLAHDLFHFENTSEVPEGLARYVVSSEKAHRNRFKKLSQTWREVKPPPKTVGQATRLINLTLKRHRKADVQGILKFYGLSLSNNLSTEATTTLVAPKADQEVMFELNRTKLRKTIRAKANALSNVIHRQRTN